MKDRKRIIFENEFKELSRCISNNGWYSMSTENALGKIYDISTDWEDTLLFMDTMIELFENNKVIDDLIIIQSHFSLSPSPSLNISTPPYFDTIENHNCSGSLCVFPLKLATIINRTEFFQKLA